MADADAAWDTPKVQLPPFTPPKFHWNQDNQGQYKKCSNNVKCGSILNWLGIEAYPIYDNLPIMDAQKEDPEQLLAAFEKYFKPECNVFQSWYTLGSIYSNAFKTQSEFYHK